VKLTKKQRAEVVELLRCAADREYGIRTTSNWLYFRGLRISFQAEEAAMEAWWSVPSRDDHRQACLEAAARVEEGSWP
jgi:hypothetical protein